jgi:glucose-1-phosphate thymidylyltransferase
MHAIIPVAGRGTRMRPLTWSIPKVLIPLAGKTMLGHIIDDLVNGGVDHITLIVGHLGDMIVEWSRKQYPGLAIDFAVQEKMDGLASAINLASPMAEDGPTLVVLGDTLFSADISKAFNSERHMIAVQRVEDPRRFGVVVMDGGRVKRLCEKPEQFVSDLAIVGIYGFTSGTALMEATSELIRNGSRTKGEFQLTDAMQNMLESGQEFGAFEVDGWFDCGKPETLLDTNRSLLLIGRGDESGETVDTVIIPPVSLGPGVRVERSVIGPFVSVASGTVIEDSIMSDCVVGEGSRVRRANLADCILGNDVTFTGRAFRTIAGSNCAIDH